MPFLSPSIILGLLEKETKNQWFTASDTVQVSSSSYGWQNKGVLYTYTSVLELNWEG